MLELAEILDKFARRRTDASNTGSETTGNRYVREVVGRRDDDGSIPWESRARVKPWALWLREERDKTLWDATRADLRMHLREMQRSDYSPKTLNLRLAAISTLYQELAKMEELPEYELPEPVPENPAEGIDKQDFNISERTKDTKKSKGLDSTDDFHAPTPAGVDNMINNVPGNGPQSLRDELLIKFMAWCGLRRSEVAKAKVEHLDRDANTIYVPPMKSDTERVVPYPESMDFVLDQWLDNGYRKAVANSYAGDSPFLFPTQESEHVHPYSVNRVVKQAAETAGIQDEIGKYAEEDADRNAGIINKITAHSLRHHYGVQSIKSGIPITYLKELMGHHSTSVTETYLDLATDDTVEVGRRFNPTAEVTES